MTPHLKAHIPRSDCGSGGCASCPFSHNELAEQVQTYGCLPSAADILRIKETSGHNWACHTDESVLCGGLATIVKRYRPDLDISVGHRISY